MYKKVVYADDTDPIVVHAKSLFPTDDVGNSLPWGWRSITDKELIQDTLWTNGPSDAQQFRQVPLKGNDGKEVYHSVNLFFYADGTGVAMVTDYWTAPHVRWYAFGCVHEYKELSADESRARGLYHAGSCWHVNECSKCGCVSSVDSSD